MSGASPCVVSISDALSSTGLQQVLLAIGAVSSNHPLACYPLKTVKDGDGANDSESPIHNFHMSGLKVQLKNSRNIGTPIAISILNNTQYVLLAQAIYDPIEKKTTICSFLLAEIPNTDSWKLHKKFDPIIINKCLHTGSVSLASYVSKESKQPWNTFLYYKCGTEFFQMYTINLAKSDSKSWNSVFISRNFNANGNLNANAMFTMGDMQSCIPSKKKKCSTPNVADLSQFHDIPRLTAPYFIVSSSGQHGKHVKEICVVEGFNGISSNEELTQVIQVSMQADNSNAILTETIIKGTRLTDVPMQHGKRYTINIPQQLKLQATNQKTGKLEDVQKHSGKHSYDIIAYMNGGNNNFDETVKYHSPNTSNYLITRIPGNRLFMAAVNSVFANMRIIHTGPEKEMIMPTMDNPTAKSLQAYGTLVEQMFSGDSMFLLLCLESDENISKYSIIKVHTHPGTSSLNIKYITCLYVAKSERRMKTDVFLAKHAENPYNSGVPTEMCICAISGGGQKVTCTCAGPDELTNRSSPIVPSSHIALWHGHSIDETLLHRLPFSDQVNMIVAPAAN